MRRSVFMWLLSFQLLLVVVLGHLVLRNLGALREVQDRSLLSYGPAAVAVSDTSDDEVDEADLLQDMAEFVATQSPSPAAAPAAPVAAALTETDDERARGLRLFEDSAMFREEEVAGFDGAFAPWASTSDGFELLPPSLRQARV